MKNIFLSLFLGLFCISCTTRTAPSIPVTFQFEPMSSDIIEKPDKYVMDITWRERFVGSRLDNFKEDNGRLRKGSIFTITENIPTDQVVMFSISSIDSDVSHITLFDLSLYTTNSPEYGSWLTPQYEENSNKHLAYVHQLDRPERKLKTNAFYRVKITINNPSIQPHRIHSIAGSASSE